MSMDVLHLEAYTHKLILLAGMFNYCPNKSMGNLLSKYKYGEFYMPLNAAPKYKFKRHMCMDTLLEIEVCSET